MNPGTPRAINPHLPTGAYALDSLPDAEHARFQDHLTTCQSCVDETAGLIETAALLGAAVDHDSPTALRPAVLDAIRFVHQIPPDVETRPSLSRRQGFRRAATLIGAACLTALAVAGVHNSLTSPGVGPTGAPVHTRIGDLLAAPDLRLITAPNQAGTAAVSASRDEMLFLASDLRALPPGRVYQLWRVGSRGPASAGVALPGSEVTSLLLNGMSEADEIILTVEPAGGSPSPTGAPVVTIVLH
ncbi:anti-sigma factor domain-containing protein [Lentzea sp. NPDC058450]|uniref:anti-sigma factor n=1 Tax=Lentzea sp. NPDC058450 TaxID=3346505 RepID=UPI0036474168